MRDQNSESAGVAQRLRGQPKDSPAVLVASAIALAFGLFSLGRALLGL